MYVTAVFYNGTLPNFFQNKELLSGQKNIYNKDQYTQCKFTHKDYI
jgi:hypothetical protein